MMSKTDDRQTNNNIILAKTIQDCLVKMNENVVFAESCTGGEIVSTMTKLPGISKNLCGSFVSYRPRSKEKWLSVDCRVIEKYTTESKEVAKQMAFGALEKTPEASWSLSVVGHLGPNVESKIDGKIYICVVRRTKKGRLKVKEIIEQNLLGSDDRVVRQKLSTEFCLTTLARILTKHNSKLLK